MDGEHTSSEASELDGLPDADRKETQEIIDEIDNDAKNTVDEPKPEGEEKKADESKEESKDEKADESKDGKKPDTEKDDEKPRRDAKLVPAWVMERAKADLQKKVDELQAQLAGRNGDGTGKEGEGKPEPTAEQKGQLDAKIKELVAQHPNISEDLVRSLIDLGMEHGGKLPPEVMQKLETIDQYKADTEAKAEEAAFNKDFDAVVIPLIKAEYGDKVAQDTIETIREKLKGHAYSDEYAKTPFGVIYRGIDEFRGYGRPNGSAMGSQGRTHGGGDEESAGSKDAEEFANVTDADIDKMDGPTFDRYSAYQQSQERGVRR